ncbi:hypothetical protein [Gillisia hiemivivida]|uniref:Uncharacterized protein n=1 Tax=Gillisia hiemivivida TaxID=291190 RepID=A0A5C6ZTE0_9FLAO|nr:hypothetical protein [Gillisia hiemivivida]TXD94123.1 hypothetical protein ES724_07605 [Gillisia hiemivivida]
MKKILLILAIMFSSVLSAQDVYTQKNTESHDAEAERITKEYNKQLSLDANQFVLFEKKIEEFLIKRAKIEKRYTAKDKLDMLYRMQARETIEMKNILTRPQLKIYRLVKSEIQPIAVVEEK